VERGAGGADGDHRDHGDREAVLSATAQLPKWTPLAVSDRKLALPFVYELLVASLFGAIGVGIVWTFLSREGWWILLPFAGMWFAILAFVMWARLGRWWVASRYAFFEEGMTIRGRRGLVYLAWNGVTAADLAGRWDRQAPGPMYGTWHVLTLVFDRVRTVKIPLTVFANERCLCEAIVERIPVEVERPRVPLQDV
jgi:hypothetical protein